jgi:deazaflavin-dependent oxidoreductase (nitroreductase family)
MSEPYIPAELPSWISDHVKLYLEDPDKARMWDSTPAGGPGILACLLLITRGRKTGNTSMLPLLYGEAGNAFVIVASKGGAPAHPAWYLNLVANPECEIRVGRDKFNVRARKAEGDDREKLWQLMAEIYPPYNDYQAATDREIPVVVLDPLLKE